MKTVISLTAIGVGITLMTAQPANAAALFICDFDTCSNGVSSPDPNVTFTANDFEGSFQLNSLTIQRGLGNPTSTVVSENANPLINFIDGAAENDFSGTWILGGPILSQNETVFFINQNDPLENGTTGVSDVLHYTYTQDAKGFGHLDGTVISDVTGALSIADLNADGIFATQTVVEAGAYDFSNTNISAAFQSEVPEPTSLALLGSSFAIFGGILRRKRRRAKLNKENRVG